MASAGSRRTWQRAGLAVGALFLGGQAMAAQDSRDLFPSTVLSLLDLCKDEMAEHKPGFCLGFLVGITQMMAMNGAARHEPGLCLAPGDTLPAGDALIQIFIGWARKHPEQWSVYSVTGVGTALSLSFPCQK